MAFRARTASYAAGLALAAALAAPGAASADVRVLDGASAPIVRVNVRDGDVVVRTWDREAVEVDGDPSLVVERRTLREPPGASVLVPAAHTITAAGDLQLPPESFVVPAPPPGPREAIVIRSGPATVAGPVTVTVPASSPFVFARAGHGNLDVRDYRGGTLLAFTGRGTLALRGDGGTVFAQSGRGPIEASESSFDRIRARSLAGNIVFERCAARQIESTSVDGSIVYDGGTFAPGLARFESVRGDVAVGSASPAQLSGRAAGEGRVFTSFDRGASVRGSGAGADAVVGGGGPVVMATSERGNVYLYGGTLRDRPSPGAAWDAPLRTLRSPRARLRPAAAAERGALRPARAFAPQRPPRGELRRDGAPGDRMR